jgi:cysteine desulfurase / selenocysteine lyase
MPLLKTPPRSDGTGDPGAAGNSLDIRRDFPLLERIVEGQQILYLDSAATSLKPRQVLDAERLYSTVFTANIHRGKHFLSEEASFAYESARRRVARFLNGEPEGVVFVPNATHALNMVAAGLGLRKTDPVLCLAGGHHSNLVPWMHHGRCTPLDAAPLEPITVTMVEAAIERHAPRVLALTHVSNVTGAVHPVAELCKLARSRGIVSVVDGAQSVPHMAVDVSAMGCDFLAFSGHKMLAPTGIGVLYGRPEMLDRLVPLVHGGGMVNRVERGGFTTKDVPHRLEAGTPNISGVIGLAAALDYLENLGWDRIAAHEAALKVALQTGLRELPARQVILDPDGPAMASIVPRDDGPDPDTLAVALSETHRIITRSGFHCAHVLFDEMNLGRGALRASAYVYNTVEEIQVFCRALLGLMARLP